VTFRGVANVNSVDAWSGRDNVSSGAVLATGVTTTVTDAMLVGLFVNADGRSNFTSPAGMTERYDTQEGGGNENALAISVADGVQNPIQFSGDKSASTSRNAVSVGHLIALRPDRAGLHHLEILHGSGSGLTCAANILTVRACADALCTTPYTSGVSGTLSATGTPTVNWDGTTGGAAAAGFVIPAGSSSATKNVHVATVGSVVFGITSPIPAAVNPTTCNFGSPSCTFTASTAGFIFTNSTTGTTYTIPIQIAGIATPTLYLRALQTSTTNPAVCTPAIIGQTTPVTLGYTCNNPTTCQPGNLTTINTTAIAPAGTSVSLSFDANGSAPITVRYDDVGQITLNASKIVTSVPGGTAVTLNGGSNTFVVKPYSLVLTDIKQSTAPNTINPAAADATGGRFVRAGEAFSTTVTAVNASCAASLGTYTLLTSIPASCITPNYGKETTPETVILSNALVTGLGLTNNPTLGNPAAFGAFSSGSASGTTFRWDEAGIIRLTPAIGDGDYLGAGTQGIATQSGNVGRFYPSHFTVSSPSLVAACSSAMAFTNFGQDGFSTIFTLTARNTAGDQTLNYSGDSSANSWAKLPLAAWAAAPASAGSPGYGFAVSAWAPTQPGGSSLAASSTPPTATNSNAWANGTTTTTARHLITRPTNPAQPTTVTLTALPVDRDGVTMASAAILGDSLQRFGVLRMDNAYGSELLPIRVPVRALYWDVNRWRNNIADTCTSIAPSSVQIGSVVQAAGSALAFAASPTGVDVTQMSLTSPGMATLIMTPSTRGAGSADLRLNLGGSVGTTGCGPISSPQGGAVPATGLAHLAGNWCGSDYDRAPTARIKFGSPKAPYIYLRERY
jgi:MSHA biogenesis protein MshQ